MVDMVLLVFPAFSYLPWGWMEPELSSEDFLCLLFGSQWFSQFPVFCGKTKGKSRKNKDFIPTEPLKSSQGTPTY